MMTKTKREGATIDEAMAAMSERYRYRWCEVGWCGCLGCANAAGGLLRLGFTKADWLSWVERNPKPGDKIVML